VLQSKFRRPLYWILFDFYPSSVVQETTFMPLSWLQSGAHNEAMIVKQV
jgi:hypothetical protein